MWQMHRREQCHAARNRARFTEPRRKPGISAVKSWRQACCGAYFSASPAQLRFDYGPAPRFRWVLGPCRARRILVLCWYFVTPGRWASIALALGPRCASLDAYFRGDVDIEGDLFAALSIKDHLESLKIPIVGSLITLFTALRLVLANPQRAPMADRYAPPQGTEGSGIRIGGENREAIHFHYDVSNEFCSFMVLDQCHGLFMRLLRAARHEPG